MKWIYVLVLLLLAGMIVGPASAGVVDQQDQISKWNASVIGTVYLSI